MRFQPLFALLFSVMCVGVSAQPAAKSKIITVSEGTDMAVTVSPDHKTMLMDLQGLIFSLPFAGGPAKQITTPYNEASHPAYAPDGSFVAIQSYAGGTFHIWTMKPDGTGLKQITTGHGDDREPQVSPDRKTIAFSSDRAFKGSYDVWTVDIASGRLKQITSSVRQRGRDRGQVGREDRSGEREADDDCVDRPGAGAGGCAGVFAEREADLLCAFRGCGNVHERRPHGGCAGRGRSAGLHRQGGRCVSVRGGLDLRE
jgi:hypothetical protein